MTDTDKLLKMKKKIDEAERERDRADGRISSLENRLKQEHECKNLDEAERKQKRLEEDIQNKEKNLSDIVKRLKKDYDWS